MDLGLSGRTAVVMGSTRGIGFGIARRLAAEGAAVGVCGRRLEDAVAAADGIARADEVMAADGAAQGFSLDLADAGSVAAFVAAVEDEFPGDVDIVVCNGGGPPPGDIADVAAETWETQFRTMFVHQLAVVNAFLPGMRSRGWGRILVVASSGVIQPIPNLGISNALRAAHIGWAKSLSNEVAKDGVTVNTLVPGRIHTARVDEIDAAGAKKQGIAVGEFTAASKATIPMGRYGTVDEFADTAAYLVSANASYLTGGVIRVDGGYIRSV